MKKTLFLISKIIFLYLMILSNSFADSHIKIIKLNKPIDRCYGLSSNNICNKVEFHVFDDSQPSFIIADNISTNQSWSALISNKCIFSRNLSNLFMKVECPIDSERFVIYTFYLPEPNFIVMSNINYHTCSNNDKEKITESLISKFKKDQMVSQLSPNQSDFIMISDKKSFLSAQLFEGKYPLASAQSTGVQLALRCPGDVRLILTISSKFYLNVSDAIRKFKSQDSKTSTPKF